MEIKLPVFTPRDYQKNLFRAIFDDNKKRAFCIWHRRAGKDLVLMNLTATKIYEEMERGIVGTYYYFFPTYNQARKVIWDGRDGDGKSFLDAFPRELIARKNEQEMRIELKGGSAFQLIGTDKYDAVRGTNPLGCAFSEFAFQNPLAWDVIRPILTQNKGWAIFNTTPNGKNHAYDLYEFVKNDDDWFVEVLDIDHTKAISREDVDLERKSGMSYEMVQQEFFCSFDIGAVGAFYTQELEQARSSGRITSLPFSLEKPIDIYFDIGISKGNETAIWFKQNDGAFFNFIHYYENSRKGFDFYATYIDDFLDSKKAMLGKIYIPHDAKKEDWASGITAEQAFRKHFGDHKIVKLKCDSIQLGVNAARKVFPKCRFDREKCLQGIRCLEQYHREWDDVRKCFKATAVHDWSSNGADSFRYFSVATSKEEGVDVIDPNAWGDQPVV